MAAIVRPGATDEVGLKRQHAALRCAAHAAGGGVASSEEESEEKPDDKTKCFGSGFDRELRPLQLRPVSFSHLSEPHRRRSGTRRCRVPAHSTTNWQASAHQLAHARQQQKWDVGVGGGRMLFLFFLYEVAERAEIPVEISICCAVKLIKGTVRGIFNGTEREIEKQTHSCYLF